MIKFAKDNSSVKIPIKENENAGFDIYANFDEPFIKLESHKTTLIPTGLFSCFEENLLLKLENRGSNGSKGLLQACGIIDSSYRGEWFVAITNTNNHDWYIMKKEYRDLIPKDFFDVIKNTIYPYEKAICQFIIISLANEKIVEVKLDEIKYSETFRGSGKLGSSGK